MFAPGPFKDLPEPGGPLYADDLQRLYGAVSSLEGLSVEAPLALEKGPYGVSIRFAGKTDRSLRSLSSLPFSAFSSATLRLCG